MFLDECIKCKCTDYDIRTTRITTKSCKNSIFSLPEATVVYIKICLNCGYMEFYSEEVVNKDVKKNPRRV